MKPFGPLGPIWVPWCSFGPKDDLVVLVLTPLGLVLVLVNGTAMASEMVLELALVKG